MCFSEYSRNWKQQVNDVQEKQPRVEDITNNNEPRVNNIMFTDKGDNMDEELAVDDYLVQNVEMSGDIESPEVATIKWWWGELKA